MALPPALDIPVASKYGVLIHITDSLIIAVTGPESTFVKHSAFSHNGSGVWIVCIVSGSDAVHANFSEEKSDHGIQRFGRDPLMPPPAAKAIADLRFLHIVPPADDTDRADGLFQLLQNDHPLVEFGFFIFADPMIQNCFGLCHCFMGGPGQIFCHIWIRSSIAEHWFRILPDGSAQDQSGCIQRLGSTVCQHERSLLSG